MDEAKSFELVDIEDFDDLTDDDVEDLLFQFDDDGKAKSGTAAAKVLDAQAEQIRHAAAEQARRDLEDETA